MQLTSTDILHSALFYFQTMNILIAASRGGGLASMIRGYNVIQDVSPGASLRELTGRAIVRIPPPGCSHYDVKSQSFNPGLQYPHLHGPVHTPDNNRWDTPPV